MNILVVDDSATMRKIVVLALGKNVSIIEAENGREALGIAAKEQVDLMILDINMPELSGMEFLAEFGKTPKAGKIPIIMLSTHTEKEIQDQALALGAKAFLTKPFQKPELLALVASLTGQSI